MTPLRRRTSSLVWLALLAFAAAALPRDAWYVHRHAANAPGHVHEPGVRASSDDAWWEELLAESTAHQHPHGHDHRHAGGAEHDHASAVASRGASGGAEARPAQQHHGSGPALAATTDAAPAHAHWQAPFQAAASVAAPAPTFVALDVPREPPATSAPARGHRVRLRARAPPVLPSV